jgi:Holliday junction resolvase
VTNSNDKGDRNERELVNYLDRVGWTVIRIPASGSATERDLPDVLVGNEGDVYAFEAKSSGDTTIYIDAEEVEALNRFSHNFGAKPRLTARFEEVHGDPSYGEDWPGHYVLRPEQCHVTDVGNLRIKKELALEEGVPIQRFREP